MDGEHLYKALLQGKYTEVQPIISPHGHWMAYMSDESGKGEIYVRSFPDMEKAKSKVSTDGGNSPLWSPDEKELFYLNNDEMIRGPIETDPAFKAGKPETLFHGDNVQLWTSDAHTWDISPDGKRFLMMKWSEMAEEKSTGHAAPKINVVLNWFEELKERVPVE